MKRRIRNFTFITVVKHKAMCDCGATTKNAFNKVWLKRHEKCPEKKKKKVCSECGIDCVNLRDNKCCDDKTLAKNEIKGRCGKCFARRVKEKDITGIVVFKD